LEEIVICQAILGIDFLVLDMITFGKMIITGTITMRRGREVGYIRIFKDFYLKSKKRRFRDILRSLELFLSSFSSFLV